MKHAFILSVLAITAMAASASAEQIFSSQINTLPNGTTISTSNSNFTSVSNATAKSPGSFGNETSVQLSAGTTGAGSRIRQDFGPALEVMTVSLDFNITASERGNFQVYAGTGGTINGANNGLNSNHLMWMIRISSDGQIGWHNGANSGAMVWSPEFTIVDNTAYNLFIQVNGTANDIEYEPGKILAADKMNVYLNGELVFDNVSLANRVATAAGMRISAGESDPANGLVAEIANIKVYNDIVAPIPEPATTALLLGAAASSVFFFRRRKAAKRA